MNVLDPLSPRRVCKTSPEGADQRDAPRGVTEATAPTADLTGLHYGLRDEKQEVLQEHRSSHQPPPWP